MKVEINNINNILTIRVEMKPNEMNVVDGLSHKQLTNALIQADKSKLLGKKQRKEFQTELIRWIKENKHDGETQVYIKLIRKGDK